MHTESQLGWGKPGKPGHPDGNLIGLVRESGGYGDIVCLGAAARAIKLEGLYDHVVCFVPESFSDTARHLVGVDEVISLGSLADVQPCRRPRDSALDDVKYPYLQPLLQYPNAKFVDLYCPGFDYENSCDGPLRFNRCQLFAAAVGAKNITYARSEWKVSDEERALAREWRKTHDLAQLLHRPRLIGVQLRGTCAARSIPISMRGKLVKALSEWGRVVVFDCADLPFEIPPDAIPCIGAHVSLVAAILEECNIAVTVDSFLWHLTAALDVPAVGIFGPTDGKVSGATYPLHTALDGWSDHCTLPCNYNYRKNWDHKCRELGCSRMKEHTVESIVQAVQKRLGR